MPGDDIVRHFPIISPQQYFQAQAKSLQARIDDIQIPPEEEIRIRKTATSKLVRDQILGLFKIGDIIKAVVDWNKDIDSDLRDAKKDMLITSYFNKCDDNTRSISNLTALVSNPYGNTIFNKILRIVDDTPPDEILTQHLASALKHIADTDFVSLFEAHKYAISMLEKITPQALTILSDYAQWPLMELGTYSANGGKVSSEWLPSFTRAYCHSKLITDSELINRVAHSINDLIQNNMIETYLIRDNTAQCKLTEIGKLLIPYIQ